MGLHQEIAACKDSGVYEDLTARFAAAALAERRATSAMDEALVQARRQVPPVSWNELAELSGYTARQLRIRHERLTTERNERPVTRTPQDDPKTGLSLQVAAQRLGINRQTLANHAKAATPDRKGRVRLQLAGHDIVVLVPDGGRGVPWRVWIDPKG